jgi:hypothetical protein
MSGQKSNTSIKNFIKLIGGITTFLASIAAIVVVPEVRRFIGLDSTITPTLNLVPTLQSTIILPTNEIGFQKHQPTFTPVQVLDLSTVPSPTETPGENLLFSDNFDNGINNYWNIIGNWMTDNGQPVLVEKVQTSNSSSPFAWAKGGLILPAVSKLDNYAVEFDFYDGLTGVLFSYKDENNYKIWSIVNNGDDFFIEPGCQLLFVSQGKTITIPQSEVPLFYSLSNHIRIEIRGKSFALYLNKIPIYNFQGLPDSMTGPIGIVGVEGKPVLDNINIYQLP